MLNECDLACLWTSLRKAIDVATELAQCLKQCLPGSDQWPDHPPNPQTPIPPITSVRTPGK